MATTCNIRIVSMKYVIPVFFMLISKTEKACFSVLKCQCSFVQWGGHACLEGGEEGRHPRTSLMHSRRSTLAGAIST